LGKNNGKIGWYYEEDGNMAEASNGKGERSWNTLGALATSHASYEYSVGQVIVI